MKKILTILLLIMLIISFFQISNMYALYKTQVSGEYESELGIWSIKINNEEITSKEFTEFTNKLTLQSVNSERVMDGKIAPESEFFIELIIDPMQTDVSIVYKIECGDIETINNRKLNIKMVNVTNTFEKEESITNEKVLLKQEENANYYVGVIPKEMINNAYKNKIKVYFKWETADELDSDMGRYNENLIDEETGTIINEKIILPVKMELKQYIGEDLNDI